MMMVRKYSTTRRGGFTIAEIVVSIGILLLVAVGVATIFGAVGDTVALGRSVSQRNEVVAQLERVMRRDFQRMSRRGFIVIRHEHAIANADMADADANGYADMLDVPLYEGDTAPRPRRVDSVLFFAEGEFESARPPILPSMKARSGEAMVYYGHGTVRNPETDPDLYRRPDLRDSSVAARYLTAPTTEDYRDDDSRLGWDPGPGLTNPNRFPADPLTPWTLLRRATLLIPDSGGASQALPVFGDDGFFGTDIDRNDPTERVPLQDAPFQVALQPAVDTVFWFAQVLDPELDAGQYGFVPEFAESSAPIVTIDNPGGLRRVVDKGGSGPNALGGYDRDEIARARLSSGLIDIATTSIADVRTLVTAAGYSPSDPSDAGPFAPTVNLAGLEGQLDVAYQGRVYPLTVSTARQQRQWMISALPTAPVFDFSNHSAASNSGLSLYGADILAGERTTARMRYEHQPPALNIQAQAEVSGSATSSRVEAAYREADQAMLTRAAFLPRCTEFIVEWSFGDLMQDVYPYITRGDPRYGQFVWYGRNRWAYDERGQRLDMTGEGTIDDNDRIAFEFDPTLLVPAGTALSFDPNTDEERRLRMLSGINGDTPTQLNSPPPEFPLHSVFGYFDADEQSGDFVLTPWEWPALIRVTLSYTDPGDQETEHTVQFVFNTPGR